MPDHAMDEKALDEQANEGDDYNKRIKAAYVNQNYDEVDRIVEGLLEKHKKSYEECLSFVADNMNEKPKLNLAPQVGCEWKGISAARVGRYDEARLHFKMAQLSGFETTLYLNLDLVAPSVESILRSQNLYGSAICWYDFLLKVLKKPVDATLKAKFCEAQLKLDARLIAKFSEAKLKLETDAEAAEESLCAPDAETFAKEEEKKNRKEAYKLKFDQRNAKLYDVKVKKILKEEEEWKEMKKEKEERNLREKIYLARKMALERNSLTQNFTNEFNFTLSGGTPGCYLGTAWNCGVGLPRSYITGSQEQRDKVEQLHLVCSKHPHLLNVFHVAKNDGFDHHLVTERVCSVEEFFDNKLKAFGSDTSDIQGWWDHIEKTFRVVFRDVVQALRYLFENDFTCGSLAFNIYVTEDERGRLLPTLLKKSQTGVKTDIKHLMDVMKKIITLPLVAETQSESGDVLDLMLPSELAHFLTYCASWIEKVPAEFWIWHPYWWTVPERVKYPYYIHKVMKNSTLKTAFQSQIEGGTKFSGWTDRLSGMYKQLVDRARKEKVDTSKKIIADRGNNERAGRGNKNALNTKKSKSAPETKDKTFYAPPGTTIIPEYKWECDIPRFYDAVYSHHNDPLAIKDKLPDEEIEKSLSFIFPDFFIFCFEMICSCTNAPLTLPQLEYISQFRDGSDAEKPLRDHDSFVSVSVRKCTAKLLIPSDLFNWIISTSSS